MISVILGAISAWVVGVISTLGYGGIVLLMAIESANIPLPSEVIMPFSGYLVSLGRFDIWLAALAGAFGCVVGSVFSYWLGMVGGRPLIERYGKYVLISHHDLDLADRWFQKYGDWAVFFSRLLPVVRTFISFPAGIARTHFKKFVIFTFVGSFPWTLMLAYLGVKLGDNREVLSSWFHRFDFIIGLIILAGIVWWIWRHVKNLKK